MSNVGQGALIVIGTVVGTYFGYPQLGFVLGSLAGNALFPTQLPGQAGPRMSDNQTTSSVVGTPLPILFGTASLSGCFMWLAPIVETTNTENVGGKGGPTQTNTTYTYNQSVAVGLCEGPIAGISRIWENGTLVYDIRPQLTGENDTNYANRLTVAAVYAETFTLHLGDEEQVADATIESIEGMGNVPGFRGLAYIVYPNRKLREDQALRHPSFKFEAFQTGIGNCVTETRYSNSVLYPWLSSGNPSNPDNLNTYSIVGWDPNAPNFVTFPSGGGTYGTLKEALDYVAPAFNGSTYETYIGYAIPAFGGNTDRLAEAGYVSIAGQYQTPDPGLLSLHFNCQVPSDGYWQTRSNTDPQFTTQGSIFWLGATVYDMQTPYVGFPQPLPPLELPWNHVAGNPASGFPNAWFQSRDTVINVHRDPSAPRPVCEALTPASGFPGYGVLPDGNFALCTDWVPDTANTYLVLQQGDSALGGDQTGYRAAYPLNPVLLPSDPRGTEAFWTDAYNAAVADGKMPAGYTYEAGGAGANSSKYPISQSYGFGSQIYTLEYTVCEAAGSKVSIGSIIRAICARCGLDSVDASDMDAVLVDGYAVASVSAGRDILTPLRSVGFFDCVESGDTLKFVARGKAVVASLTSDDFGAYDGGANPTPGPAITTVKAQDADLPLQTRVHYFATSRDYEAGEQLSPTRLTTTAVNVVDVELAVCMSDEQAAKIADVIWADAWAERWSGTLAVDQARSDLEPSDCIEVPVDGVTRRIRIINETVASGVLRTLNYVRDDDGAYVSHAVAAAPIRQPQRLKLLSATDLFLLDLPALIDADNDAGIYAAARGSSLAGNAWGGCVIFRSADGGATFAQLGSITTASTVGALASAVTPSDWHTWDDVTTITVNVPTGVTFESRTDAAVLTGANSAAMGADGRWEIVQFANATQLSPTQWRLSRLLRGRRGTEHNIDSSQVADKFIMISTGGLVRLPLQTSEIGANRIYKAVTIGASYSSGIDQTFSGHGVALRPFSPVLLTAERDTSGDIILNWTRRGRLGRTLMSGVDIPLSEATEAYQVDIYTPDSPHTVVRMISATTPTATYTAAQQSTDFGSDSATHVMVAVYQMSAVVGRGTPDVQTLLIS